MSRSFFMDIRGAEREVIIDHVTREGTPEWHVEGVADLTPKEDRAIADRIQDFLLA